MAKEKHTTKDTLEARQKEVEQKAEELSVRYKTKVHPLLFMPDGEVIVGYLKEPNREFKKKCIDLFYMGQVTNAGTLILENGLIREESDARILSEASENDTIYMGALMEAIGIVKFISNAVKKN